ncbi:MAG: hypothetical protein HQM08_01695 [Candidatus Riflebacteria bacterium]|nr:hypothetical protein [Candidatus Riflebacteria bacterium]
MKTEKRLGKLLKLTLLAFAFLIPVIPLFSQVPIAGVSSDSTVLGKTASNTASTAIPNRATSSMAALAARSAEMKASSSLAASPAPLSTPSNTSSAPGEEKSAAVEQPSAFSYTTDSDTEKLQKALEAYNSYNPNEPIKSINGVTILLLQEKGFLKEKLKNQENIILNSDGKVVRRVKNSLVQDPVIKGRSAGSLFGLVNSASLKLSHLEAKKGTQNNSPNPNIPLEKRSVTIRTSNGESKEVVETVPKLIDPPDSKPSAGVSRRTSPDSLQKILPAQLLTPSSSR